MTRVELDCITMLGNEYALFPRGGAAAAFPQGELRDGEHPAEGVRRLLAEWTGTQAPPKLEVVDFAPREGGALGIVFRAMLVEEPTTPVTRAKRMELPEQVGRLSGKWVEEALKTSLAYKLTRSA